MSFSGGDFFADPLPRAEVYILGHILHDWGMDAKRALLQRIYDALPEGGAAIVYETLIDDQRRANAAGLLMSLNMLVLTDAGFDYTGADCQGWMADAGFRTATFSTSAARSPWSSASSSRSFRFAPSWDEELMCTERAPVTNIIFGTMTLGYRGYGRGPRHRNAPC